nr:hypothetical transcript [Hymenolepis microstoma]
MCIRKALASTSSMDKIACLYNILSALILIIGIVVTLLGFILMDNDKRHDSTDDFRVFMHNFIAVGFLTILQPLAGFLASFRNRMNGFAAELRIDACRNTTDFARSRT